MIGFRCPLHSHAATFSHNLFPRVTTMKRLLGFALALVVVLVVSRSAEAQVYQVYYAGPSATYYQPAPYQPVLTTAYYQPAPVTTYYAPAPTTVYYAPPVATTYYRPLIGGTISGWRYNYPARTYVYPTQVAYYPGW
jgi:hypothetical protein